MLKTKNLYLPLLVFALLILLIPIGTSAAGFEGASCTEQNASSDCYSMVCIENKCTSPSNPAGGACNETSDCQILLTCLNRVCVNKTPTTGAGRQCDSATPCETDLFCGSFNTCEVRKDGTSACTKGEECKSGVCDPNINKCTTPAGATTGRTVMKLPNFLGTTSFSEVIGTVIKTIIGMVGSFALIMFIYGGGLWLISAGRKEFVDKGKKAMIWAAIGLAVVFASYILVNTVFDVLIQT